MEEIIVKINGIEEKVIILRKKIKNIYLRISDKGEIIISAPKKITLNEIEKFVSSKEYWIAKTKNKLEKQISIIESEIFKTGEKAYILGKPYIISVIPNKENKVEVIRDSIYIFIKEKYVNNDEYIKKVYEKWFKEEFSYKLLYKFTKEYFEEMKKYRIPMPVIEIKKMKLRWGACFYKKNKVVYNFYLAKAPIECVKYVVVHELSHFKYHNHSKEFYAFVSLFITNWKNLRKILNKEFGFVIK